MRVTADTGPLHAVAPPCASGVKGVERQITVAKSGRIKDAGLRYVISEELSHTSKSKPSRVHSLLDRRYPPLSVLLNLLLTPLPELPRYPRSTFTLLFP